MPDYDTKKFECSFFKAMGSVPSRLRKTKASKCVKDKKQEKDNCATEQSMESERPPTPVARSNVRVHVSDINSLVETVNCSVCLPIVAAIGIV